MRDEFYAEEDGLSLSETVQLALTVGHPKAIRPGAVIEFKFFTDADPVVCVIQGNTATQRLKFSEWQGGDASFRSIIAMMRTMATETRPKWVNEPQRGALAGLINFEVFMTPAFEGEHVFNLWAYDEGTDQSYPFGRYVKTAEVLQFCDELERLLNEDAVRRGVAD